MYERESQLAVFDPSGTFLQEKSIRTANLGTFIDSLPGKEKHVVIESLGFIYPVYDKLRSIANWKVAVANPNSVKLIARSKLKHDRADAKVLCEHLRINYLPLSYIPKEKTRDNRYLVNDRVKYGLRWSHLRGTIRWLLKRRGITEENKMLSIERRKRLRSLSLREFDIRLDGFP